MIDIEFSAREDEQKKMSTWNIKLILVLYMPFQI